MSFVNKDKFASSFLIWLCFVTLLHRLELSVQCSIISNISSVSSYLSSLSGVPIMCLSQRLQWMSTVLGYSVCVCVIFVLLFFCFWGFCWQILQLGGSSSAVPSLLTNPSEAFSISATVFPTSSFSSCFFFRISVSAHITHAFLHAVYAIH